MRKIGFFYRTLVLTMGFILLFFAVTGVFRELIIGAYSVGISMLVSNGLTGVTAGVVAMVFIRKLKREGKL